MRKKMEWQWEKMDEATYRAKIIGGWLVLHCNTTTVTNGKDRKMVQSESMAFVADRDHEWTIIAPIQPEAAKPTVKAADFEPK